MNYTVERRGNKYGFINKDTNKVIYYRKSKEKILTKVLPFRHILIGARSVMHKLSITGVVVLNDKYNILNKVNLSINVGEIEYPVSKDNKFLLLNIKIKNFYFILYKVKVPYIDLSSSTIHNKVAVCFKDAQNNGAVRSMRYSLIDRDVGTSRHRSIKILPNGNTIFIRQSSGNRLYITNRRTIQSDYKANRFRLFLAYFVSKFYKPKNITLLYEKESSRYEEGASIVYESLINKGYKKIYFIIDKNSDHFKLIDKKYTKNLIFKHTFKHYFYFFAAKSLIGSELPSHAIDLRVANKYAVNRLKNGKFYFVFLQHGVSYMISFGSNFRKDFKKGTGMFPSKTNIVVSSELEADHFVDYANFENKDLLITGMPKFDKSIKNKDADKIVIMPTWRPWEYNQAQNYPEETGYFKMIDSIVDSVPKNLKDKIQILPHPLFLKELKQTKLKKYIDSVVSYDEVLRTADTLITDYSSIAFDAFYRGSKVIFWWKDLRYCMKQYDGFLMLNEENTFGDVVKNKKDLKRIISLNYSNNQNLTYKKRFKKIVEFNDNKNTDRVIKYLNDLRII